MTYTDEFVFEAQTPLGFCVRTTRAYWTLIVTIKHPVMDGREIDVRAALENPDEVRRSKTDPAVYLFYLQERQGWWICAVTKRLNGDGFLITTYPTDAVKEGVQLWHR